MAVSSTLVPVAVGFVDLTFLPTGASSTCTATIFRAPSGQWQLIIWPAGAILPAVVEGTAPTPCADAIMEAMFGPVVQDYVGRHDEGQDTEEGP